MKQFEKVFRDKFIEYSNEYEYKDLKNKRGKFYKLIIQTINEVIKKSIISDSLVLLDYDFNKLRLEIGKSKTLVFCGCYVYKGEKVIMVERKELRGTYIYDDEKIVRQFTNVRIGTTFQIEKTVDGAEMLFPQERINIGLFKE